MAKKVNTAIIGGFVIVAIGLLLSSILIFSSGTFFKKRYRFVLFFDENISGLTTGAPVKFRGVEIGTVKSITLLADKDSHEVNIPILIEIDPQRFKTRGTGKLHMEGNVEGLIEMGLRARLDIQSFVTGQYYIQLDFLPETEVRLRGIEPEYREIPTVKSSFTKLSETFKELPLRQIVENVEDITVMVKEGLAKGKFENLGQDLTEVLDNVNTLMQDADELVATLQKQTSTLGDELLEVVSEIGEDVNGLSDRANRLLDSLNSEVGPIADEIRVTLSSAQETLDDASKTLTTAEQLMGESEVRFKLGRVLEEMGAAARSIRELGDYLERHPESLIQGKQTAR